MELEALFKMQFQVQERDFMTSWLMNSSFSIQLCVPECCCSNFQKKKNMAEAGPTPTESYFSESLMKAALFNL